MNNPAAIPTSYPPAAAPTGDPPTRPLSIGAQQMLLRQIPQSEIERLFQAWQNEQNAATRDRLNTAKADIESELAQIQYERNRLAAEINEVDAQLAALLLERENELQPTQR